ncbi:MAG: glycosyltransferase family 4 protein [Candidatus Aminicenantaceae bacterium]
MQKTKVLHIITRLDKGGSAENTFLTVRGLDKTIFDVTLVGGPVDAPEHNRRKQIEDFGIEYIFIPELVRRISPFNDLKTFCKLYRIIRKGKFDIVHTHTSKGGFLGRFAAKFAGVPIIVHTPHGHVFFGYFGPAKTKLFILLEKIAARITDKIIALTEKEKDDTIKAGIADGDKFVVIFSGVELDKFKELPFYETQNFKKELGIPENSMVAGTVGRLETVKGPEFLIQAAQQIIPAYPNTFFIFAGDGNLRLSLERQARESGVESNVVFLGWRDDVVKIISIFDVFVLPSLNEGMGRVLVEAMALNKPIVASNIGGIPDLVTQGRNGFLVPPKNPEKLAQHIQILLEDKQKREEMGLAGREMALNFSSEKMVEIIAELYKKLLIQKNIYPLSSKRTNPSV